jgi:hypothetical protein
MEAHGKHDGNGAPSSCMETTCKVPDMGPENGQRFLHHLNGILNVVRWMVFSSPCIHLAL